MTPFREEKSFLWDSMPFIIKAEQRATAHKGGFEMRYTIKSVRGHIEVYDEWGSFLFSADTEQEAREDIAALAA